MPASLDHITAHTPMGTKLIADGVAFRVHELDRQNLVDRAARVSLNSRPDDSFNLVPALKCLGVPSANGCCPQRGEWTWTASGRCSTRSQFHDGLDGPKAFQTSTSRGSQNDLRGRSNRRQAVSRSRKIRRSTRQIPLPPKRGHSPTMQDEGKSRHSSRRSAFPAAANPRWYVSVCKPSSPGSRFLGWPTRPPSPRFPAASRCGILVNSFAGVSRIDHTSH